MAHHHFSYVGDEEFHATNDEKRGGCSSYFLPWLKCFRTAIACLLKIVHSVKPPKIPTKEFISFFPKRKRIIIYNYPRRNRQWGTSRRVQYFRNSRWMWRWNRTDEPIGSRKYPNMQSMGQSTVYRGEILIFHSKRASFPWLLSSVVQSVPRYDKDILGSGQGSLAQPYPDHRPLWSAVRHHTHTGPPPR